jgi:hypothetical protein
MNKVTGGSPAKPNGPLDSGKWKQIMNATRHASKTDKYTLNELKEFITAFVKKERKPTDQPHFIKLITLAYHHLSKEDKHQLDLDILKNQKGSHKKTFTMIANKINKNTTDEYQTNELINDALGLILPQAPTTPPNQNLNNRLNRLK